MSTPSIDVSALNRPSSGLRVLIIGLKRVLIIGLKSAFLGITSEHS